MADTEEPVTAATTADDEDQMKSGSTLVFGDGEKADEPSLLQRGNSLQKKDSFGPLAFQHQFSRENPGNLWDYYEKGEGTQLGEGSFGKVFRTANKKTGFECAVKSIEIRRMKNPEKFQRELDIAKTLDHPNVVRLFEMFRDLHNFYLVMELCEGGELFDRIIEQNNHGFDEAIAASYLRQIVSSLSYLHAHHFAHRDVKPENFLFHSKAADSLLKLVDFGLSTRFEPGVPMHTKVGTVYYVCPELLSGSYSEKCDVWSAGVINYILLCGMPPFSGKNDREVLQLVKRGDYSFPSPAWDSVSEEAKATVTRMMTVIPEKRPTAEEVLADPWLTTQCSSSAVPISKDFVARLQSFNTELKMKKVALTALVQQISDEHIEALQKVFLSLDGNGDGVLSPDEIRDGLQKQGIETPQNFDAVLNSIDFNRSQALDYTEFLAALVDERLYMQRDVCWAAFCQFDLDGDGKITRQELAQVLNRGSVKQTLGEKQIERLISEADVNQDGCIDFEEFCSMMGPKPVPLQKARRRLRVKTSIPDALDSPPAKRPRRSTGGLETVVLD